MSMKMLYELELRDKNGSLLKRTKRVAHSFVRNWIRMLRGLSSLVNPTLTDASGVSRTFYTYNNSYAVIDLNAGSGIADYGVQVGTSDVAFDKTHYSLQGKIAHGSGSGQLLYGATTVEEYTEVDTKAQFRTVRVFTNSSGSPITVKEIGIVVRNYATAVYYFLAARDVITPQTVPDGATLTIRYTLYYNYS
jgi:hypothetical protein